ncbi:MAG: hypothetical protein AAFY36_12720 [Bacteroidota bacterium]
MDFPACWRMAGRRRWRDSPNLDILARDLADRVAGWEIPPNVSTHGSLFVAEDRDETFTIPTTKWFTFGDRLWLRVGK